VNIVDDTGHSLSLYHHHLISQPAFSVIIPTDAHKPCALQSPETFVTSLVCILLPWKDDVTSFRATRDLACRCQLPPKSYKLHAQDVRPFGPLLHVSNVTPLVLSGLSRPRCLRRRTKRCGSAEKGSMPGDIKRCTGEFVNWDHRSSI
jgi:hypothetical protein